LAIKRHWTVSFALSSILWSKFKSAEEPENAEMAFVLLQKRDEEAQELAKPNLLPSLFSDASLESREQALLLLAIYK
jgi:hypothetical protein